MGIIINGLTDTVTAADGSLNIGGDVTIPGELSYDDVTNIDSVGIITARDGIDVTGGNLLVGATDAGGWLTKIQVSDNASYQSALNITNNVNADLQVEIKSSETRFGPSTNTPLVFKNGGGERLRITSDGKIGIGDVTPENSLTIKNIGSFEGDANSFYLGSNFTGTGQNFSGSGKHAQRFFFNNASSNGYLRYENTGTTGNAGDAITWQERLRIDSSGNVGINETTPDSKLDIVYHTSENSATANLIHLRADPGGSYVTRGLFVKIGRDGAYDNSAVRYDIVGSSGNSGFHAFEVQGNEKLRITKDGKLILSGTARTSPFIVGDGGMCIEQSYDGLLKALSLRNKDTDAAAATALSFSLNRSGGDQDFEAGEIKLVKEQAWTTSSSTVDGSMVFSTIGNGSLGERLRIDSDGNLSVNHNSPNTRLYVRESGASISSAGNAILNSTQKGIRLVNSNNDDTSLGLWFTTGDSHHAGISGQRTNSASHWGTDLRFYTHEGATNDLTYTRERHRITCNGLLTNRKGNNAINTGGTLLGRYKYTQQNQGSGYGHLILGADGRKLQDYITTNCYCIITVCVTGTGTDNMFCQYYYWATSSASIANLTHMYGNSGSSSNRPYMQLVNTSDPVWKMSHNGGYTLDIEVAIYGGSEGYTFTTEYGNFTSNP